MEKYNYVLTVSARHLQYMKSSLDHSHIYYNRNWYSDNNSNDSMAAKEEFG